jgi:hypothetical protein
MTSHEFPQRLHSRRQFLGAGAVLLAAAPLHGVFAQDVKSRSRPILLGTAGGYPFLKDEVWADAVRPHFSGNLVVGHDAQGI